MSSNGGGRGGDNGRTLHTFCKEAEDKLLPKTIARTAKLKLLLEEYMLDYIIALFPEKTGTFHQSSYKACCTCRVRQNLCLIIQNR